MISGHGPIVANILQLIFSLSSFLFAQGGKSQLKKTRVSCTLSLTEVGDSQIAVRAKICVEHKYWPAMWRENHMVPFWVKLTNQEFARFKCQMPCRLCMMGITSH